MSVKDQNGILQKLKHEFIRIGYAENLLQEDYVYADVFSQNGQSEVKSIPLAVFSHLPFSYRTASFGVALANGRSGPTFIQDFRSLGAPQIFEVHSDQLQLWKVTVQGDPKHLETVGLENLSGLFGNYQDIWAPRQVSDAKSGAEIPRQLDFIDLGLMPALDHEVRRKINELLEDSIALGKRTFERKNDFAEAHYPLLFRLVFRLIASKILSDRDYPNNEFMKNPVAAIRSAEQYCFGEGIPEPVLNDYETQEEIWSHLKNAIHFQNLSVDTLAYVYENTLVTDEARREWSIHSTPPAIAEYIVKRLPFEDLAFEDRRVFEPFSGHSVFLVAAMQRLREILPPEMSTNQQHDYLVNMLAGIETDSFAREVARLSLMLADYPNPDGWNLHEGDVFDSPQFEQELRRANIILCNPPFGKFSTDEKTVYRNLRSNWKPAEILNRVLQFPPKLLGFVLPRAFLSSGSYQDLRTTLGNTYSSFDVLSLPDRVFQNSEAETVLLLSSGGNQGSVRLRTGRVYEHELDRFYTRSLSWPMDEREVESRKDFADIMWLPPISEVWQAMAGMNLLSDFASVRTGIRYKGKMAENEAKYLSVVEKPGFSPGVQRVQATVEPYVVTASDYFNMNPALIEGSAHNLAWSKPKLIINASRRSREAWPIAASVDYRGLIFSRNFYGLWPTKGLKLEVIAAILNGPVANAFVHSTERTRYIQAKRLKEIPVPDFTDRQQMAIESLVQQYIDTCDPLSQKKYSSNESRRLRLEILQKIDGEVLKVYDLEPRLERKLLDYFNDQTRLGPFNFTGYFPPNFKPCIPWHIYISEGFKKSKAKDTLNRLPVIAKSPLIGEFLTNLDVE